MAKKPTKHDPVFLQSMIAHFLHQDKIIWSQIRTLIAIHAGILPTSYYFKDTNGIGSIVILVGAFYTFLLFLFILKAEDDRDINLRSGVFDEYKSDDRMQLSGAPQSRWRSWARGWVLMRIMIISLILIDLILAYLYFFNPASFIR